MKRFFAFLPVLLAVLALSLQGPERSALAASTAPAACTVLTFQPGGTGGAGRYTTWAALFAAANAYPGPVTVFFDGSHNSGAATIPSGTWAFTAPAVTFEANVFAGCTVTFASGATVTGVQVFRYVTLVSSGGTPPVPLTGTARVEFDGAFAGGAVAVVGVSGSGTSAVINVTGNSDIGDGTDAAFTTGTGATTVITLSGFSTLETASVGGAGTNGVQISDVASSNLSGATQVLVNSSTSLFYDDALVSPSISEHNVQDAIDYLKSHSSSGGITQLTGDGTAGPGSGSQALTIANLAVSKLAHGTTGTLLITNGSTPTWTGMVGDGNIGPTGSLTVTGIRSNSVPSPSGTNTVLQWSGTAFSWATPSAGTSVTGSGFWYSASGSLNSAAVGLSGDGSIGALSGGNLPLTLSTVNANVGSFGSSSVVPIITVNAKGLTTAVSTATIAAPLGSATGTLGAANGGSGVASPTAHSVLVAEGSSAFSPVALGSGQLLVGQSAADPAPETVSGDATVANTGALTLATVNSNVGSFGTSSASPSFTVNAKGLITAASSATIAAPLASVTGTLALANLTHGTAGQLLVTNTGATAPAWATGAGDLTWSTGTPGSATVTSLSSGSTIAVTPSLQWTATTSGPSLSQATGAAGSTPQNITVTPQTFNASSTTAITNTPGGVTFALQSPGTNTVSGSEAYIAGTRAGAAVWKLGALAAAPSFSALYLSTSTDAAIAASSSTLQVGRGQTVIDLIPGGSVTLVNTPTGTQIGATQSFGGGSGNMFGLSNDTTDPTGDPASGNGIVYESHTTGALTARHVGSAVETLAPEGDGTVGVADGHVDRFKTYGTITTAGNSLNAFAHYALASSHSVTIRCRASGTITTAGSGTTLVDTVGAEWVVIMKNVSGTITDLSDTTVAAGGSASIGSSLTLAGGHTGTTPGCQFNQGVVSGTLGTETLTIYGEAVFN